jgi:hypothetical protein
MDAGEPLVRLIRFSTALAALLVLPAVGAHAAPRCRNVATDPRGDTSFSEVSASPGMDITAVNFRSDAKTLVVATSLVDVDATTPAAPLGRMTSVLVDMGEASFMISVTEGLDGAVAELHVGSVDEESDQSAGSASAWSGQRVAYLTHRLDRQRNQLRVDVPLAVIRKHAGAPVSRGSYVTLRDAMTWAIQGTSTTHGHHTMDGLIQPAGWTLGAASCA